MRFRPTAVRQSHEAHVHSLHPQLESPSSRIMITKSTNRIIYGGLIHSLSLREIQALPKALIAISALGVIEWIEEDVEPWSLQEIVASHGWVLEGVDFIELGHGEWIMPGFIDTHTHAPQFPNMGIGGEYELLDWLANVTFPTEAKFADVTYAREVYTSVVQRVLNCGTTTCCYYGTLHLEATKVLADIILEKGQRAFVGKCNMDRHAAETYQEPSAERSLIDTKTLINYIRSHEAQSTTLPLVKPILTPRFAIACSAPLLSGLGEMATADPTLHIQTHISENASEVAFTKSLFPECETYAGVYDKFGLLKNNTILAHACLLEESELQLIKEKSAGISHCPTSNFNLRSGLANVGEMLDRGIKVGLGTDVSGGFSPSILTAIQHASICSKVVSFQTSPDPLALASHDKFVAKQLPISTLLYLATLGGAEVCNLSDSVGNFLPGKEFDAILVTLADPSTNPCIWFDKSQHKEKPLEELLEKFIFGGDDRNITRVWVRNHIVGGSGFNF